MKSPRTPISTTPRSGRAQACPGRGPHYALCAGAALLLTLAATLTLASPALASAWWRISARAAPTYLPPGGHGLIELSADDLGDSGVSGAESEITIEDQLPAGLSVSEASAIIARRGGTDSPSAEEKEHWSCSVIQERDLSCSTSEAIPPYESLAVEVPVAVNEPPATITALPNRASVQGGTDEGTGAAVPGASQAHLLQVSNQPVPFGIEEGGYSIVPEEAGGSLDAQAGSHPFQLTSTLQFNQILEDVGEGKTDLVPGAPALPRNLNFELPPGLLGNVTATERCSALQFQTFYRSSNLCPAASVVGVATVTALEPNRFGYFTKAVPLFNLEPARGEPARFGFEADWIPVTLDASLRSGSDYGVTVSVKDATEAAQVLSAQVTFWGTPGAASHDASRGWACIRGGAENPSSEPCPTPASHSSAAFLTLPTSCGGELFSRLRGEAWSGQPISGESALQGPLGEGLGALEGCPLPFKATLGVQSEEQQSEGGEPQQTHSASTPTGLALDVHLDQQGTLSEASAGDSDLNSTTVTLPEGMLLSPSAANGLQACSEAQIGFQGPPSEPDPLSPAEAQPLSFSEAAPACPQASKLGEVQIETPLLGEELKGSVYLAEPAPLGEADRNPFGSLIALYITAESQSLGIRVKLAGEGRIDTRTGQISTTFKDTPQLPFEDLRLKLFGGPRGPVSTPARCGAYATDASFTPWSSDEVTNALSAPGELSIESGPGGSACPDGALAFSPSFGAGSESSQAGAFTSFQLQIAHPDGDQALSGVSLKLPPGVAALLASVTPCPEPQAARGECSGESEIGKASASAGLGPDPYTEQGRVYITGPYDGAPFGLSIVTPAVAGPFDLGNVIVRASIDVDPHTAQVSIRSGLPTFLQGAGMPATGIPLQLKGITVSVDRPNFEYNPTSCEPMKIEGTLQGAEGASQGVSSPFQVSGCQNLPFKPHVTAQTRGRTSKADGASLSLRFVSAKGQANVAKTVLTIPAILPARLSTIQKACLAQTFEANPASCPEGSDIGSAIVHTPVLESPLTGPIYLVSHGNAAWPDAELVLQGEGITVILDGQTAIKKGITTSSFLSVPDAPFQSLEASLPEGPHSALTTSLPIKAKYSLCGKKLQIPMVLTGQNGAVIEQKIPVSVQGCGAVKAARAKKLTRAQRLKKALASCRRRFRHSRARRVRCEARARKAYGPRHRRKGKDKKAKRAGAANGGQAGRVAIGVNRS
jgi:hypothetical protein